MNTDQTNEPRLSADDDLQYHEWCRSLMPSDMKLHGSTGPNGGCSYWLEGQKRIVEVDHAILEALAAEKKRADEAVELLSAVAGAAQLELKALQDELHNEDGICHRWTHQQRFGKLNVPVQQALATLNTQGTADAGKGKTDE